VSLPSSALQDLKLTILSCVGDIFRSIRQGTSTDSCVRCLEKPVVQERQAGCPSTTLCSGCSCSTFCAEPAANTWRRLQHAAAEHLEGLRKQLLHPARALRRQPVPASGSTRQRQDPNCSVRAVHAADCCIRKGTQRAQGISRQQAHGCSSTYQAFTLKFVSLQHGGKIAVSSALEASPNPDFL
jgi:hypothetical protein